VYPLGAMSARIPLDRQKISEFCRNNRIRRLALFGSAIRDDFTEDSDVDFLVEFEPDGIPGFIGLAAMELELSRFLGGRRVDMNTAQSLSTDFRARVESEAEVQYEAA